MVIKIPSRNVCNHCREINSGVDLLWKSIVTDSDSFNDEAAVRHEIESIEKSQPRGTYYIVKVLEVYHKNTDEDYESRKKDDS